MILLFSPIYIYIELAYHCIDSVMVNLFNIWTLLQEKLIFRFLISHLQSIRSLKQYYNKLEVLPDVRQL